MSRDDEDKKEDTEKTTTKKVASKKKSVWGGDDDTRTFSSSAPSIAETFLYDVREKHPEAMKVIPPKVPIAQKPKARKSPPPPPAILKPKIKK
jgi:hypothetical protein